MRTPNHLALLAPVLLLLACQGGPGAAPIASGNGPGATAAAAGNAAATNTVAAPPPILELKGTAAFAAAGPGAAALAGTGESTVEPRAAFRVELPIALADARLSLLDGGDAMVPATGTREVGQATVLTLTPAAALAAGARFRLRVDGVATRELHAADGRRFAPLEWQVVVAGEPEPKRATGRKPRRR